MIHHIAVEQYYNAFGSYPPAYTVEDGDTLITTTLDARGYDAQRTQRGERSNPLTGPFFVRGAEPGDALEVRIEQVRPNRRYGWSGASLACHVVDADYVHQLPPFALAEWEVDAASNTATLVAPQCTLTGYTITLAPMLGCLGVAPARGQAISSATSGPYGGNMDYRGLAEGMTAYFPVFAPGALLFVGDGHALQGDGEIVGMGIEISMDVRLSVRVRKGWTLGWPRCQSASEIITLGNARPLDQALQHATTEMNAWLQQDYSLDAASASILLGQAVRYEVGNVFDPAYTVACKLATALISARRG